MTEISTNDSTFQFPKTGYQLQKKTPETIHIKSFRNVPTFCFHIAGAAAMRLPGSLLLFATHDKRRRFAISSWEDTTWTPVVGYCKEEAVHPAQGLEKQSLSQHAALRLFTQNKEIIDTAWYREAADSDQLWHEVAPVPLHLYLRGKNASRCKRQPLLGQSVHRRPTLLREIGLPKSFWPPYLQMTDREIREHNRT